MDKIAYLRWAEKVDGHNAPKDGQTPRGLSGAGIAVSATPTSWSAQPDPSGANPGAGAPVWYAPGIKSDARRRASEWER